MHFFLYLRKVTDPKGSVLNEAVKLEGEEEEKRKKKSQIGWKWTK